jgi:ASC-1-like (ASCH) protein
VNFEEEKERYNLIVKLVETFRSYEEEICPEEVDYVHCDTPKLEEGIYIIKNGIYEMKETFR